MYKSLKKRIGKWQKKATLAVYYMRRLTFSSTRRSKTIIICFNGILTHGGLIDRLKGIISFYEVSRQLNYDFKIQFNHPFDLSIYLEPNECNWKLDKEILYNPFESQIIYLMDHIDSNPINKIKRSNANIVFVYCNLDYLKMILPDSTEEELAERWRSNFNSLFKKSDYLTRELAKLPKEEHIVFHARFTSLMGDFKDTSVKIISEEEKKRLVLALEEKIRQRTLLMPNISAYVLSDSKLFLDHIKTHTAFKILEGEPKHLEIKDNHTNLESDTKTFTDFFFISMSDHVYLLKEKRMYMSSFPKYAAIIGNKPFQVI
jgi:hypothetical protein